MQLRFLLPLALLAAVAAPAATTTHSIVVEGLERS